MRCVFVVIHSCFAVFYTVARLCLFCSLLEFLFSFSVITVTPGRKLVDKPRKEQTPPAPLDNKKSDGVVVVGKGYSEEAVETPPKNSLANIKGSRDRRQRNKGGEYNINITGQLL